MVRRDFASAQRSSGGGDLITKMPVIIEGESGATVSVPRDERDRVALLFGRIPGREPFQVEDGYAEVRFEPCADRQRTGFVGGLVIRDRPPVVLQVRLQGTDHVEAVTIGTALEAEA